MEIPGFIPVGGIAVNDDSYETIRCIKENAKCLLLQDAINQQIRKTAIESAENIITRFFSMIHDSHIKKVKIATSQELFSKITKFVELSNLAARQLSTKKEKKYLKKIVKKSNSLSVTIGNDCKTQYQDQNNFHFDAIIDISKDGKVKINEMSPVLEKFPNVLKLKSSLRWKKLHLKPRHLNWL